MAEGEVGMSKLFKAAAHSSDATPGYRAGAPVDRTRYILAAIILLVICQSWLIFEKAINWDEFLHFGFTYELAEGRLRGGIQTFYTRLFGWATSIPQNVIGQIQSIRFVMLACAIITTGAVTILARRLVSLEIALLCGFIYLSAGFVFTNAFTYRTDPVAAAALMSALCVLAFGKISWMRMGLAGMLVGFAGAMTIKSIFYLPCFAAFAWLRWNGPDGRKFRTVLMLSSVVAVSLVTYLLLIALHRAGLPPSEAPASGLTRSLGNFLNFFQFEQVRYVFLEAMFAPVVSIGLVMLPFASKGLSNQTKILLIGLCAPLLCILFYRNTYPYFFTFLLPPICVAIAPALSKLVDRYRVIPLIIFALIGPAFLIAHEPYGTLERQHAVIDEVERLFPEPAAYVSFSSYVPHYPRLGPSLMSGPGLKNYWELSSGQIAKDIDSGRIAFVIVTDDALNAVFKSNGPAASAFLPKRDVTALRANFLEHSDTIFILGHEICPDAKEQAIQIVRSGPYSLDGGDLVINGRDVSDATSVHLKAGMLKVHHQQGACVKLWGLDHVPVLPEHFPSGPIGGGF